MLDKAPLIAEDRSGDPVLTPADSPGVRRLDVQGLRAIAVLAVIAFHAGLPLPGGFLGVDVFFVISGFVITAMLLREHQQHGRIRFGRFYLRRFKRLGPALALMIVVTLLVSALLVSPIRMQNAAGMTGVGAIFLSANIFVRGLTGGYFDPAASLNPLTHTWSLSVEEQFYLIFPAVLAAALAWGSRRRGSLVRARTGRLAGVVLGLAAASLGLLVLGEHTTFPWSGALLGFYGALPRIWEFAAGALLAVVPHSNLIRSRQVATVVGGGGVALLAAAFLFVSEDMAWPGPWMVLPVAGTMLLIACGSSASDTPGPVTRLLSSVPMTKVGDWSYSLYLWHWPLIVFAAALWPQRPWTMVVAAAVSVVPALLSYRFVEEPIRHDHRLVGTRLIMALGLAVTLPLFTAVGLVQGSTSHWGSESIKAYAQAVEPKHAGEVNECVDYLPLGSLGSECTWHPDSPGTPIYLVGDSNADQFVEGWADAGRLTDRPILTAFAPTCPFLDATFAMPSNGRLFNLDCEGYVQGSLDWLATAPRGTVVISNSDKYVYLAPFRMGPRGGRPVGDEAGKLSAAEAGLRSAVTRIRAAGHQVILLQAIPMWRGANAWNPSACTTLDFLSDSCRESMTVAEASATQGGMRAAVETVAAETGATVWDPWVPLCPDGTCSTHDGPTVQYKDEYHLTVARSEALGPEFARLLTSP